MSDARHLPLQLSVGGCATLACLWEVTAAKPGNVYRGADFEDLTYADFLVSSVAIAPAIEQAPALGVGAAVLAGVQATRQFVGTNTNLGMLLLMAPLAAARPGRPLRDAVSAVLACLSREDARLAYEAIRLANPGGLGAVDQADVSSSVAPDVTLLEAMRLAADRDLVARQYANGFTEVFRTADRIALHVGGGRPLGDAIVRAYLELLAEHGDTLVERKCGPAASREVAARAAVVLASGSAFHGAAADFDFWLRGDGHRRNPGTSADLIAAALFALLLEGRLDFPAQFYQGPAQE